MKEPPAKGTWKQFVDTAQRILAVPKSEIDRREAEYQKERARKKRQRAK